MSDPGPAVSILQPQLDTLKGQINNSLSTLRQILDQFADVAEKAAAGQDVVGELAGIRGLIPAINDVV